MLLRTLAVATALASVACVPSLHPLYTQADLVTDLALAGVWMQVGAADTWVFEPDGEKQFKLTYRTADSTTRFHVGIVKLGANQFMDLYPMDRAAFSNEVSRIHHIRAHNFARVRLNGPVLELAMLDNDWLRVALAKQQVSIAHAVLEDGVIITAPTKDIQALVTKLADTPQAFQKPIELKRDSALVGGASGASGASKPAPAKPAGTKPTTKK